MSTTVGEAPSNWLSDIIAQVRKNITGPFFEQRRERNAIIKAMMGNDVGNGMVQNPECAEVVMAALALANHLEREQKKHPEILTASPAIQASWLIFDELGVARPA